MITPLMLAAGLDNLEAVKLLVKAGATVNVDIEVSVIENICTNNISRGGCGEVHTMHTYIYCLLDDKLTSIASSFSSFFSIKTYHFVSGGFRASDASVLWCFQKQSSHGKVLV
jgi:hypothetical protein